MRLVILVTKFMKISNHPKLIFILSNFILAFLLILAGGYYTLVRLDTYTAHNKYIAVPAFQGLTHTEAEQLAQKHQLKIVIVDSLYDDTSAPGTILEQYPLNGAHVKANRLIHLTVNAQHPEQVIFPLLNNAPYRQTLQTLKTKGFQIGTIQYAPSDFKNLVLDLRFNDQTIEPGSRLRKGSKIDIILGNGNNDDNYIPLPHLKGKTLKEALNLLTENYLNKGDIVCDASIKNTGDKSCAIVYQQDPDPDIHPTCNAGSYITLYITQDKKRIEALDSLIVIP